MEKKRLLKGTESIGESAIRSGCTAFYGYPVPTQSDLMEFLAGRAADTPGFSVYQSEDPLSAFFMAYGAAAAGGRILTAVNSIDVPDCIRAVSYFSAANLPLVCVVISQNGPGSGNIYPAQSDALSLLGGTRLGDGFAPILTPSTPSDMAAAVYRAFQLAETHQMPVIILVDAACAQLVETVDFSVIGYREIPAGRTPIRGKQGNPKTSLTTLELDIEKMADRKARLEAKKAALLEEAPLFKIEDAEDGDVPMFVAFGIAAVQARRAMNALKGEEVACRLFEPLALFPFPEAAFQKALEKTRRLFILDMSDGQLNAVIEKYIPESMSVFNFYTTGGAVPRVEQIQHWLQQEIASSH